MPFGQGPQEGYLPQQGHSLHACGLPHGEAMSPGMPESHGIGHAPHEEEKPQAPDHDLPPYALYLEPQEMSLRRRQKGGGALKVREEDQAH